MNTQETKTKCTCCNTRKQYIEFSSLAIGDWFTQNGNGYRKKSSRTAEIISPKEYSGMRFYFGSRETVTIVFNHEKE